jgi:membrane fusion protein (multidrug efflux system)
MKTDRQNTPNPEAAPPIARPLLTNLFIASALAFAVSGCKKAAAPATPPPVVQVMEVAKKKVARSTTFIGKLDSPQNVEIRARVEAFVEKILFQEGGEVKAGDLLFELNKQPYEEKLADAKGTLAEARVALTRSSLEVPRLTALVAQKAAAQKDLDTAVATKESNEANVASAEAQVKSAELNLGYCDVKAPIAGRIGAKDVSIGSLVGKGEPTLLATMSQVDPIWFYCSISEVDFLNADRLAREAGRKMGELPVTLILTDGTEHPAQGKWIFIDRVVDATTATIRARAEFPNPTAVLRPGMFARVRISLPTEEGNILVPERAVTELQGKNFVWVVSADNKASQRAVEVAPNRIGSEAVILKGLEPGERVVVEGVQKLREGAPVQPKSADEVAKTVAALVPPAKAAHAGQGETKPAKH